MFSINKLTNDLEQNQEKISKEVINNIPKYEEKDEKSIYEDFIINSELKMNKLNDILCSKYFCLSKFYYNNINWKKDTFMYSLLVILDSNFDFMLNKRKNELINSIRQKMCYDLVEKNYYNKFGYTRKKKFKREKLQKYLMDLKINIDLEKYTSVRKYIVDYFNINLFILSDDEIDCLYTEKDNNGFFRYRPTVILYKVNDIFYPVIKNEICNERLYLDYNNDKDIIEELLDDLKDTITYYENTDDKKKINEKSDDESLDNDNESLDNNNESLDNEKSDNTVSSNINIEYKKKEINYNKMKLNEIHKICKEYDIDINKISEKTGKTIKKTKKELIENIKNKNKNN